MSESTIWLVESIIDNKLGIKKTGTQWNPVITKKTVRKILLIDKKTGKNEHNMKPKYLLRNP